ncbi:hypothetical protein INT44_003051 [Umbelopsis vinacea]|uniref:tRNA (uracil-O(2)-)-methyltransferase n=1 Tax=Umbelopsis vinacea TaxID=44442 RepID=A0A8H7Q7N8_9FUNG|nr:hypothetical protein INT44_003051 [Umbelopsis vinacea]
MSDSDDLFKLFAPSYYFDKPRQLDDSDWFIVAEQSISVDEEAFWAVVKKWTLEPELVIPPLRQCDIIERVELPNERITRNLIPKRKSKDPILKELVEYHASNDTHPARVTFAPDVVSENQLPFYYPKVRAYSLVFDSRVAEDQHETCYEDCLFGRSALTQSSFPSESVIRLEIQPFSTTQTGISNDKMIYALSEVFHKLYKWCIHTSLGYEKRANHDVLVPKEMYHETYARMKAKYADKIISQWTEKTDPTKFVFEDIAIASYLICLWQLERQRLGQARLQSFVDLGCGNGLLTHLLVSEGHPGKGIDIAKRKIWDQLCDGQDDCLLGKNACSEQKKRLPYKAHVVISSKHTPSNGVLSQCGLAYCKPCRRTGAMVSTVLICSRKKDCASDVTHVRGEYRTPIMAARTESRFIVIPCCYFQLDGSRHKALGGVEGGKYREYTDYVKNIAIECGYSIDEDQLRIPSTRNIAVVGQTRNAVKDLITETVGHFVARVTDRELEEQRRKKAAEKRK